MSHTLATLLGSDHPLFTFNLHQLEIASGNASIDVRLIGDITERSHDVLRTLGLDITDTTPEELYHVLNAAVANGRAASLLAESSYVIALIGDQRVSLCLYDVIENAHHEIPFTDRTFDHALRYLRAEIVQRYAEHDRTDNQLVHNLAKEAGMALHDRDDYEHIDTALENVDTSKDSTASILMIGDIFTDAFIELDEETARVDTDQDGSKRLSLPFGSKPPYKDVDIVSSVGPSPNAAVATSRLGVATSLMAWLGDDATAEESLAYLKSESIDSALVSKKSDTKSNYYYVLRLGAERTILVKNEAYDYAWQTPAQAPDWIYLSLISEDSWPLHEALVEYLEAHPETKLAFQPGTFHFKWGAEKLKRIYKRAEIVVVNREEAVDITGGDYDDLKGLMDKFHTLGPKIVVVTDGPNGSYASFDGKKVTIPNYPDIAPPVDRTGAGDAFASTIVAGLALGESMETALSWAPINSMNVVQQLGAQAGLQTKAQIQTWLDKAPADYKVTDL